MRITNVRSSTDFFERPQPRRKTLTLRKLSPSGGGATRNHRLGDSSGHSGRGATGSKPSDRLDLKARRLGHCYEFVAAPQVAGTVEIGQRCASLPPRRTAATGAAPARNVEARLGAEIARRPPGFSRPAIAASAARGSDTYSSTLRQIGAVEALRQARRRPRRGRPRSAGFRPTKRLAPLRPSPPRRRARAPARPRAASIRLNTPLPQPTSSHSPEGASRGRTSARKNAARRLKPPEA